MKYRLGLDIGSTSIGWAMLRLNAEGEPVALIKLGVRIFPDGRNPKDGSSLAVTRRLARQMRRRRDRLLRRKHALSRALTELGFFPLELAERRALVSLDPYSLRRRAVHEALTPSEFARALFHINQRRGFKSNRKTDKKDNDSGALKSAISRVRTEIVAAGCRTIGEWLAIRHEKGEGVRARLRGRTVRERAYDLYIDRRMIEDEFDLIWACQAGFDPSRYTEAARARLKDILLYQRPLKPVEPGRCTLLPNEKRAPLALPSVQRFRIYQEVNNLRVLDDSLTERELTKAQRDAVAHLLERRKEVPFTTITKTLGLPSSTRFNLQDSKRDALKGNETSARLARAGCFGPQWHELDPERQDTIVEKLVAEESEVEAVAWLQAHCDCAFEQATQIANFPLPEGYGALSKAAIARVLPELVASVVTYSQAVLSAGFASHSALSHSEQTGELMASLPYYGEALERHVGFGTGKVTDPVERRFGRIANPTVHIGLNELRKVVNGLIERYGHPAEITVELARELKQSKSRKEELAKEQADRQRENERLREQIRPLIGGNEPSGLDVQRMRLWVELNASEVTNRRCPYTGDQIGIEMLFSDAVEIEHILPFSKTLDDSLNNKTVCIRRANRDKGNRTPFEAFGHSPDGYQYDAILERAKEMPRAKAARFAPDAYQRWLKEDKDFLARALNDTAYLSRVAKEYLTLICDPRKVNVVPGRLTAMLRGKYGLNQLLSGTHEKNREDHRHHAIDAAIIGIGDRSLLQRVATASALAHEQRLGRLIADMPEPWPKFREQVARAITAVTVSHRPDHGFQGALHNDTAYGLRADGKVARRIPLADFKSAKDVADTEFANQAFKDRLLVQLAGLEGKEFQARVELITQEQGIRRARIVEKLKVIPISGRLGTEQRYGTDDEGKPKAYKGYKGDSNYCMEISQNSSGQWLGQIVSTFDAASAVAERGTNVLSGPVGILDGAPLVMRLHAGDLLELRDRDDVRRLMLIAKVSFNGQIFLAPVHEANVDARNRDPDSGFKYLSKRAGSLKAAGARVATVSPIGETRYPRLIG